MIEDVPPEGSESYAGTWFPFCGSTQKGVPVVLNMFLLWLQFGGEYRGGRGLNMAENPGQRIQRQDTEYLDLRESTKARHAQRSNSQVKK